MRRSRGQPASEARDDLAHWPGTTDIEQQGAERSRAAGHRCMLAVVGKTEGRSRRGIERCWRPSAADGGRDGAERDDVSRGGEKNGGGSEGRHARRMRRGVPMTAIAPTRMQSNVARGRATHYDRTAGKCENPWSSRPLRRRCVYPGTVRRHVLRAY